MRLPCVSSHALRVFRTPLAFAPNNGQRYSVHTVTKGYNAAVIGGGITGLTAAFRLSQDPTCSKVTLYEKSDRVGGWLSSETIPVDGGKVVFEYGPRTLRTAVPACLPLLDLILELELQDEILVTEKSSPAALNRYIYHPNRLVRMPGPDPHAGFLQNAIANMKNLIFEPVFTGLLKGLISEPTKVDYVSTAPPDESVAEFVARRLNPDVADNLISALFHGIFAGDIDRLSAQAVMGGIRSFETPERGVIGNLMHMKNGNAKAMRIDDLLALESLFPVKPAQYWKSLRMLVPNASVLTFRDGVSQLSNSLAAALQKSEKADVKTHADIRAINQDPKTSDLTVDLGEDQSQTYNRVIATNGAPNLAKQLSQSSQQAQKPPQNTIRCLEKHNYAATVMVVNLYYPDPDLLPVTGFGYLIPRSIPFEQNPERALGVIFGSDSSVGQDTAPGTKLTVMFGGHWWDDWQESDYPDHTTAVQMSRSLLERHLGITDEPTVARSRLQRNAIPQYTVGHISRMQELSRSVQQDFNKRLTLAGCWYNGVGVADCIRQGYLAASYGVGARKLDAGQGDRPWRRFNWEDWELEGGLVMPPVQWTEVYGSERKHF